MSGRHIVTEMRGYAPPPKPRQPGGGLDVVLIVVAVVAVGALAYFGFNTMFGGRSHASGTAVAATMVTDVAWTDDEIAACDRKAAAEAKATTNSGTFAVNQSLAPGFAALATMLECKIKTSATRFCDPDAKALLVADVNDYLGKIDVIVLALNVQGAPMKLMEGMNQEIALGSAVYEMQKSATIEFMEFYHDRVTAALKGLARDGIVTAADFGAFMGMGVPPMIKKMLGGITAERNSCA